MRKNLPVLIFVGVLFCAVCSWSAEESLEGPEAWIAGSLFEFQPVLEGTEVVHAFSLENRGDAPLKILKIESG